MSFSPECIALCHARILYVHFTSLGMSMICIHLGVHDHPISTGTFQESLDTVSQCVANEVMKTPIAKNFVIVMATK